MLHELKPIEVPPKRRRWWLVALVAALSVALLAVAGTFILMLGLAGY